MDPLSWVRYLLYEFIQSSQIQLCHRFKHSPDQNLLSDQAWPNRSGHWHLQFSVLSLPKSWFWKCSHWSSSIFCEDTCMSLQCAYIKRSVLPLAEKMSNHDNCLLLLFFFLQFISQKNKTKQKKPGTCTKFVQLLLKMSTAAVFILFLFALTHVLLLWWWGGKRYEMSKCGHAICGLDQQWLVE